MKFTNQPEHEIVHINVDYRDAGQDSELTRAFVDAIGVLATIVGATRKRSFVDMSEGERWKREFLIGYAILALGEARSMLILLGAFLNRHARVHLRSLYEYEMRAVLLIEEKDDAVLKRTLKLRDAIAFELRDFFGKTSRSKEDIEREIAQRLAPHDTSKIVGTPENSAFGDMKSAMRNELQPEKRYLGTYAWTSKVPHGSIIALCEIASAIDGISEDFMHVAASDNYGNVLLYNGIWLLFWFSVQLDKLCNVGVPDLLESAIERTTAANERLKIVTPEQEAAIIKMREMKHGRKAASA